MFYLTTLQTHFIYGYTGVGHTAKDHTVQEGLRYMGYSFRLAARVLLYAPSHRRDSTHHGLCYTRCRTLAERELAQWIHQEGLIRQPIGPTELKST